MKAKTILQYALLFSSFTAFAQDAYFYNNSQSLIYLNPSFAGSNGGVRNQAIYRNQWPAIGRASYSTLLNTFDAYIKPLKGGLAVSYLNDNVLAGRLRTSELGLTYAKNLGFKDGDLKIIPSVQVSYLQRSLETKGLTLGDMLDPRMRVIYYNSSIWPESMRQSVDLSAGLLANYKSKLFIGVSAFHINQPDVGLYGPMKLPATIKSHVSYNLQVSERTLVDFYVSNSVQSETILTQLGANAVFFNHLIAGLCYSNRHGFSINNGGQLSLGYRNYYMSVMLGVDNSWSFSDDYFGANSYELSLSFNLRNKDNRHSLTSFETW